MTSTSHLAPLLVNEQTNEPYLRLPHPHSNIILTPPRTTDREQILSILNDERVYKWLEAPPFPYLAEHAIQWIEHISKNAQTTLQELQEHPGKSAGGCPVRIIREVKDDGEEVYLGDCGVTRYGWAEMAHGCELKQQMVKENDAKPVGDPEIVWCIGDYLKASHHGKGIMTAAIKVIIEQWMVPRMGAKKIKTAVFKGNVGSLRVFEKNGFVVEETIEDWVDIPESKGGGKVGLHIVSLQL